jgi:tetratricopeptide (TPR) repeat protein/tRNA A-37 threonylcarbamoyl transferase component Bud32
MAMMNPKQFEKLAELFELALQRNPAERRSFLEEACGADLQLRQELESLLAENEHLDSFMVLPEADGISKNRVDTLNDETESNVPGPVGEADSDGHVGTILQNRYFIERRLASGGMGGVYLARDRQLHSKPVVIKVLRDAVHDQPWLQKKFQDEIEALARINHPCVVGVSDAGTGPDDRPYFVMEFVEGHTLRSELKPVGMEFARVAPILRQVGHALAAAHSKGIYHLDLKPGNIMVQDLGDGGVSVKLIDFGIAKIRNPLKDGQTDITNFAGTVDYMAPEQLEGRASAASDIYALGVIAYEMVTGRRAFKPESPFQLLELQRAGVQVKPRELRSDLSEFAEQMILRALEFEPQRRPPSAADFTEQFASSLYTAGQLRSAARSWQRRPLLAVGFCLMILLPLAYSVVITLRARSTSATVGTTEHLAHPGAVRAYREGLTALHDGAYYKASKALAHAVSLDEKFALAHARLAEAWTELDYGGKAALEIAYVRLLVPNESDFAKPDQLYLRAINNLVVRNFKAAIENYEEIARLEPRNTHVLLDLGRAYEKGEAKDKAVESYRAAARLDPQSAAANLRLGVLYGQKGELVSSKTSFDKAREIYDALSNLEGVTEVFYQQGLLINQTGNLSEARSLIEKALNNARAIGNEYQLIKSLLQLCSLSYRQGDTNRAEKLAADAVARARANGLEYLTTRALINLGNAMFARSRLVEAERYFTDALNFARKFQAPRNEAAALFSLGSLRIHQGKTDEGLVPLQQALVYFRQAKYRKEESSALTLISRAKREKGDLEGAFEGFQEQLRLAREVNDLAQLGEAESGIASVLFIQERFAEALSHFNASRETTISIHNQLSSGYAALNCASSLWRLGRYREARSMLHEASRVASTYEGLKAEINLCSGEMALSESKFRAAAEQAAQVVALGDRVPKSLQINAIRVLGLARVFSGEKRDGLSMCTEAVDKSRHLGNQSLFFGTMLSLGYALLENGEFLNARDTALRAKEGFARAGQHESEWRASLLAARACSREREAANSRVYAVEAADLLNKLQQKWGVGVYQQYTTRPDVRLDRGHLSRLLKGE